MHGAIPLAVFLVAAVLVWMTVVARVGVVMIRTSLRC